MRIGLIIADFEMWYSTSFQHTARVKYDVDFNTSNVDTLGDNLEVLRRKVEANQGKNVHVGLDIDLEHVQHVQKLLQQILAKYKLEFGTLPINRKLYTITQKLREHEAAAPKEIAKQVLSEILSPIPSEKLTKKQRMEIEADALSKRRALEAIQKASKRKGKPQ
jgi:hypothetical protein